MQRCVGNGYTAHKNRRQFGNRRELSGAADLNINGHYRGDLLLGRVFVRNSPPWLARDKTQLALQRQAVHFIDHAVNVIRQTVTLLPYRLMKCY